MRTEMSKWHSFVKFSSKKIKRLIETAPSSATQAAPVTKLLFSFVQATTTTSADGSLWRYTGYRVSGRQPLLKSSGPRMRVSFKWSRYNPLLQWRTKQTRKDSSNAIHLCCLKRVSCVWTRSKLQPLVDRSSNFSQLSLLFNLNFNLLPGF